MVTSGSVTTGSKYGSWSPLVLSTETVLVLAALSVVPLIAELSGLVGLVAAVLLPLGQSLVSVCVKKHF